MSPATWSVSSVKPFRRNSSRALIEELGSKSFRIANIKEPGMRDTNNRSFRVAARAALRETSCDLSLNLILVREPVCLGG
jgi:hypothetical protein